MINNITKGTVLSRNYIFCSSLLSKARGMMFRKRPVSMIFDFRKEKMNPLHMIFVFFPIDIIFLDKAKRIIEIKEELKPFAFYNPKNKSRYIVELEKGTIAESRSKVGDIVSF